MNVVAMMLQEVQLEMREGKLSSSNHAFLHGSPTTVCGTWLNNKCHCGNSSCDEVSSRNPSAATASGSSKKSAVQQQKIIDEVFKK